MTDTERIEAMAKAMYDQSPEVWFNTKMIPYPAWDKAPVYVKAGVRIMARAALQASELPPAESLQSEISIWVTETFRRPRMDDRWTKLDSEMRELKSSMLVRDNGYYLPTESDEYPDGGPLRDSERNAMAGEFADVMHLLFQMADQYGIDLIAETRKKFEVNKQRTWTAQPDGTFQHVEVSDEN